VTGIDKAREYGSPSEFSAGTLARRTLQARPRSKFSRSIRKTALRARSAAASAGKLRVSPACRGPRASNLDSRLLALRSRASLNPGLPEPSASSFFPRPFAPGARCGLQVESESIPVGGQPRTPSPPESAGVSNGRRPPSRANGAPVEVNSLGVSATRRRAHPQPPRPASSQNHSGRFLVGVDVARRAYPSRRTRSS